MRKTIKFNKLFEEFHHINYKLANTFDLQINQFQDNIKLWKVIVSISKQCFNKNLINNFSSMQKKLIQEIL
jgi:hypothetical protein